MKVTKKREVGFRVSRKVVRTLCMMLFVLSLVLLQNAASAEENLLKKTETTIYMGDKITLSDYFAPKELKSVQYSFASGYENTNCVSLEKTTGVVEAKAAGSAQIQITYVLRDETQAKTEQFQVTVLAPEKLSVSYGSFVSLKALTVYSPEEYKYTFSEDSVALSNQEDELLIQGFRDCEVSVQVAGRRVVVGEITILQPRFAVGEKLARAVGTQVYTPDLTNYTKIEDEESIDWNTEDEKIVLASEKGIQAVALGTTKVSAKITAKNGDTVTLTASITVTDPKLGKTAYAVAVGAKKTVTVTGVCDGSTYESDANDLSCAYFADKNVIYGNFKGTTELSLIVDGRKLLIKVIVTNPKYSKQKFTMYKGQRKQFSLSGLNKTYSTVSYKITNTKVAAVSGGGSVRAIKTGVTRIQAKADGKTITVWVEICTKKAYRAARKEIAISKTKTKYSQARRMSKGYYDCSSIVSRVYRKYGVYFGSKRGWSPTAAGIGMWCAKHHKVIARKGISSNKLVPGDLIFYSYKKNGRYRNISHIEMYVGNGKSVSASSSYNRVVHYGYKKSSVVLIARPTK